MIAAEALAFPSIHPRFSDIHSYNIYARTMSSVRVVITTKRRESEREKNRTIAAICLYIDVCIPYYTSAILGCPEKKKIISK